MKRKYVVAYCTYCHKDREFEVLKDSRDFFDRLLGTSSYSKCKCTKCEQFELVAIRGSEIYRK